MYNTEPGSGDDVGIGMDEVVSEITVAEGVVMRSAGWVAAERLGGMQATIMVARAKAMLTILLLLNIVFLPRHLHPGLPNGAAQALGRVCTTPFILHNTASMQKTSILAAEVKSLAAV